MAGYIYERQEWPDFTWDSDALTKPLPETWQRQGRLIGQMQGLGFQLRSEAILETLTADVLKSSEIEGEVLDKDQVRSSIASRLGMDIGALAPPDRNVEGVVEMTLDATQKYDEPLTEERLFGWHAALFPTGRSGISKITVGAWRDDKLGPMQVVSKVSTNNPRVHYQAPAASRLDIEMKAFLKWFETRDNTDLIIRAALAHLWFVTIHPFEDGNGRIARAIADMALARSENSQQRFYSMSAQIRLERNDYYNILESTQKGGLDITPWLSWFLACLNRAFDGAETILANVLAKAAFWREHSQAKLNNRQRDIINRLLDGFTGKLTSSKYATIEKCSPDSALRDITELLEAGILKKDEGGGRSTSYSLAREINRQA
ncbi:Fic family protein [Bradyrhizobium sp.]|uniref:Fic family protein n=1 Tax=Bradyrhizobium sp. TaxID=376 RepID=UPI001E008CC0|nr:Fic family protein [Bradyrhizobium sp.]MBI5319430.1 Fic family protein [Bradyrhizobium sp.]